MTEFVGTPMWNEVSSNFLNISKAEIEIKAFVLFYIYVLWPDNVRDSFNRLKRRGHSDVNRHFSSNLYPWNLPASNKSNYIKWFPVSIFPFGPGFDAKTKTLSSRLRSCLDNLVEDCFSKPNLILKKSKEFGLGYFCDYLMDNTLSMQRVSKQVTGFYFYYLS